MVFSFQGAGGSRSPTDLCNIPPLQSLGGSGWTLEEVSQTTKKGEKLFVSLPLLLCFSDYVLHTFILISKQEGLRDMPIAAIAFHNNFNLLANVRHDVRPLVCLFIKVFAILATPQPGFKPGTK